MFNRSKFGVGDSKNPEDNQFFPDDDRVPHPDLAYKDEHTLGAEAETRTAMKLIMMDKDPQMVRERRQFMAGPVTGVLAMHLRHLQDFNRNFFLRKYNFEEFIKMFLVVETNFAIKETKAFHVRKDHGESAQATAAKQKGGVFKQTAAGANTTVHAGLQNKNNPNNPNFDPIEAEIQAELQKKAEAELKQKQEAEKQKILKNINKNGGNIKTIDSGEACVGIDSLKHFSVACSSSSFEPEHWVNFYLFVQGTDPATKTIESFKIAEWRAHIFHYMELGQRDSFTIPLYDQIFEDQFGAPDLKEQNAHATLVCNLVVDFAFQYGSLGYGYSHQLEAHHHKVMKNLSNKYDKSDKKYMEKSQKALLKRSIFPRIDPASNRKDADNILKPRHVGYPEFITFSSKSQIGSQYIRELTNKVSDASKADHANILNLKKESAETAKLFRARASAMRLNDGDFDGENDDYIRMYQVEATAEGEKLKKNLNNRNRLKTNNRLHDLQKGRYQRVQILEKDMGLNLEHQLSQKGQLKTRKDMAATDGGMVQDRQNLTGYGAVYGNDNPGVGLSRIASNIFGGGSGTDNQPKGDQRKAPGFLGQN